MQLLSSDAAARSVQQSLVQQAPATDIELGGDLGPYEFAATGLSSRFASANLFGLDVLSGEACWGDDGGPLAIENAAGNPVLAGIMSWAAGNECGDPTTPIVFVSAAAIADWFGFVSRNWPDVPREWRNNPQGQVEPPYAPEPKTAQEICNTEVPKARSMVNTYPGYNLFIRNMPVDYFYNGRGHWASNAGPSSMKVMSGKIVEDFGPNPTKVNPWSDEAHIIRYNGMCGYVAAGLLKPQTSWPTDWFSNSDGRGFCNLFPGDWVCRAYYY
jgi:hypothetical protein